VSGRLPELIHLLLTADIIPNNIRLFVMEPLRTVRCIHGKVFIQTYKQEFEYIKKLPFQRGEILEVFARLEALVFEFFHLIFFGLSYSHSEQFDHVLEFLSHSERVRLLRRWGIITSNTERKFNEVAKTRNYLAHAWEAEEAPYKKGFLADTETFARFQEALLDIFQELIQAFQKEQQHDDFDEYVRGLIERIQKTNV
jgi:hypothetical protein